MKDINIIILIFTKIIILEPVFIYMNTILSYVYTFKVIYGTNKKNETNHFFCLPLLRMPALDTLKLFLVGVESMGGGAGDESTCFSACR